MSGKRGKKKKEEPDEGLPDSEEDNLESETPKKRPGRPRKYAARPPVKRLGIVDRASNASEEEERMRNVLELTYDNPLMLKRIFHMLKSMGADTVRVCFEGTGVKMYAQDHIQASEIFVRIPGKEMVRYYCSRPYEIGMDVGLYGKVLQTTTQDYYEVSLETSAGQRGKKMRVGFALGGARTSVFSLDVADGLKEYDWGIEDKLAEEHNYPLRFCLEAREFKKHVADGKILTDMLTFEKNGDRPLCINYNIQGHGRGCFNFMDPADICLEATNGAERIRTSVKIDYLKPLSGAMVSDRIWLAVGNERPLISTFYLDHDMDGTKPIPGTHKCEIKVLTQP